MICAFLSREAIARLDPVVIYSLWNVMVWMYSFTHFYQHILTPEFFGWVHFYMRPLTLLRQQVRPTVSLLIGSVAFL